MLDVAREGDPVKQVECRPPAHEVVEWHLTYVAEAYLPSHAEQLGRRLRQAGWVEDWIEPARELVPSLRGNPVGGGWTHLTTLVPEGNTRFGLPDRQPDALPDGVASVRVDLWSITSSLTVLSAVFEWDDQWAEALDRIAKTNYQTVFIPARNGQVEYDPFIYKQLEARRRRRLMRRHVSAWLHERVRGAFVELGADLPALDVITSAWSRPFREDPPLAFWDYREALSLDRQFPVGSSPSLPDWRLALDDPYDRHVLTLAGRTAEVFDDRLFGRYGGASRGALANFLSYRVQDLVCSWTTVHLFRQLHVYLASTRDRAPTVDESAGAFALRLSRDVDQVLRRGTDAGALCSDLLERPEGAGPLRVMSGLDFIVQIPGSMPSDLKKRWTEWLTDQAHAVRRLERDQQTRLSTSAELSGLVVNVRLQRRLWIFAGLAVLLAAATIAIGILQLTSSSDSDHDVPQTQTITIR